ncbi:MAG: metallophosphoesterase family protein [Anaerolineae bacterium]
MSRKSTVRIALCGDTHFWPGAAERFGDGGSQLQPWSEQVQAALLAQLAAAGPDLVLHLGDFTCGGGVYDMPPAVFSRTLAAIQDAFRGLPAEYYGLPGNHDCLPGQGWAYAGSLLGLEPGLGRTVDLPPVRLVLLNAQGHSPEQIAAASPGDPTYGWVSQAELARLADALAGAEGRPVLVFLHQLLRPWVAEHPWREFYRVKNAAAVLEVLARYGNARAVFQSHAHHLDVHPAPVGSGPCWFVVAPAIIEYPLAWLQLDLAPGQLRVSMQRLPLPDLAELSRTSGAGQDWRAGRPEWHEFGVAL